LSTSRGSSCSSISHVSMAFWMLHGLAPQGRRHLREAERWRQGRKNSIKEWGLGVELINQKGEARTWTAAAQCGERRREVLVEIGRRDPRRHRCCWVSGGGAGPADGGKWARNRGQGERSWRNGIQYSLHHLTTVSRPREAGTERFRRKYT